MRKVIYLLFCSSWLAACGQNTNPTMNIDQYIAAEAKDITADNIVDKITSQIKHYKSEIIYSFRYEYMLNFFYLTINDIPLLMENESSGMSAIDINNLIYKKGKYTVKYRMYPEKEIFEDDVYLKLTLKSYDLKNENVEDKVYSEYKTPFTIIDKPQYGKVESFDGSGKTYYEGEFTIDVQVPYELHAPFENAQDLRKLDAKILEKNY